MHTPPLFKQNDVDKLKETIRINAFATLVSKSEEGPEADHIPLYLHEGEGGISVLRGHIAKANLLWKNVENGSAVLAIFHGTEAYISPNYYPSKKEHGKAVPTWNYVIVHVKGKISFIHDNAWKLEMLNTLTNQHEAGQEAPWKVSDAPEDYIEKMLGAIVGLEIQISSMQGQWKLSQNKTESDKAGVIKGLESSEAKEMAQWVKNNQRAK